MQHLAIKCASGAVEVTNGATRSRTATHIRPAEIKNSLVHGHWEGDLIKDDGNRSSVGTLDKRGTGFVVLAKMDNASTKAVVDNEAAVLKRVPAAMRQTMTYDGPRSFEWIKNRGTSWAMKRPPNCHSWPCAILKNIGRCHTARGSWRPFNLPPSGANGSQPRFTKTPAAHTRNSLRLRWFAFYNQRSLP
jgi:hypothetical protein